MPFTLLSDFKLEFCYSNDSNPLNKLAFLSLKKIIVHVKKTRCIKPLRIKELAIILPLI